MLAAPEYARHDSENVRSQLLLLQFESERDALFAAASMWGGGWVGKRLDLQRYGLRGADRHQHRTCMSQAEQNRHCGFWNAYQNILHESLIRFLKSDVWSLLGGGGPASLQFICFTNGTEAKISPRILSLCTESKPRSVPLVKSMPIPVRLDAL